MIGSLRKPNHGLEKKLANMGMTKLQTLLARLVHDR